MTIDFTAAHFTAESGENTGIYFSKPFKQNNIDEIMAIGVHLEVIGIASLQTSINEVDWADIADTEFACNLFGLQIYSFGHKDLSYRIKTDQAPTAAQILN